MTQKFVATKELVDSIANIADGGKKGEAKKYLDATIEAVKGFLGKGQNVRVKGLVDFTTQEVAEGQARNPKTGETVTVEAHVKRKAKISESIRKA